jgi:SAM-dependent methyltransferase
MFAVEEKHWWYVALHDLVLRFVGREAGTGREIAILDAGCGTGRLCRLLERFGRVTGCDISELALARCRERGVAAFQADLGCADLGEERYDIITSIDVLYHQAIPDEAAVLASFHRALKPGGVLVLNVVAHEFLRSTHDIAVHTRRRYTRADLLPLLAQAGFGVERASYRLAFLFAPIAVYRLARRLLHPGGPPEQVPSDVSLPPAAVNRLLLRLAMAENRVIERSNLAFGTSLFAVARKPG